MTKHHPDHAVVLGGSVAGLMAAAALAQRYARVTVVERDVLPRGGPHAHRRAVPQGRHVHGLLPQGRRVVEELLPGFTERIVAAGGHRGDILGNTRWYLNGRRLCQAHTGLTAVSASRPLIEGTLRDLVLALPNVTLLDGHDVVGVCGTAERVTGARVTSLHGAGSRVVPAAVVADATGRGSRAPQWLADLGLPVPPEESVRIDLAYTSRVFAAPEDLLGDDVVVATARFPGQHRSAVMQRLEGGRVLVTLAGVHGERAPADLPGFTEYAASLPVPDTADAVRAATPLGEAMPFRFPTYVRRRYEQLESLPEGLLVLGDAACAFNPVYGQGMSVAAMCADVLRGTVEPAAFFAAQARLLDAPWTLAVRADVEGPSEPLRRLQLAAEHDPELAAAFIRVTSLVDPPSALAAPWIAERLSPAGPAPRAATAGPR
ncbi:FAD-dependent oxidoreductase [Dactylosporangium aurantiacum]|uniref:FAD-dependent oxidoreductase n=1 Tax=Dactylosporangium aurantiacum TaxID=35754 RepID=A0A9Q9IKC3_9ACTN|nr:FAD-dependent oxidoreductase [Dactylosporangium aurantiacum]MDG6103250.1 FAD-dependent oxidoreductase [Dactylosporangium aurantiacum]UWZ57752.1 FAD-dependent oxidoreductase [Dactylosporangium aurantiacum]